MQLLQWQRLSFGFRRGRTDPGQVHPEDRSVTHLAIHPYVSAGLFYDPVDRCQAEARAFSKFLGGEKRIKIRACVLRSIPQPVSSIVSMMYGPGTTRAC